MTTIEVFVSEEDLSATVEEETFSVFVPEEDLSVTVEDL